MGIYVNPGNDRFKNSINSQIYIDKTGIIGFLNSVLDTEQRYVAVSRPRRFGKSMVAELISAYYGKGCDSRELFKGLEIEKLDSYEKELNKNAY